MKKQQNNCGMITSQLQNLTIAARQPQMTNSLRSNSFVIQLQIEFFNQTSSDQITTHHLECISTNIKLLESINNYKLQKS